MESNYSGFPLLTNTVMKKGNCFLGRIASPPTPISLHTILLFCRVEKAKGRVGSHSAHAPLERSMTADSPSIEQRENKRNSARNKIPITQRDYFASF